MDAKRFTVGTIAGGITFFVIGYLIYMVLLGNFFAANMGTATGVNRATPLYWSIALGSLFQAALICYVLGARAGAGAGARVGAVVMLLAALAFDFIMYGTENVSNLTSTLVDPVASAVLGAIVGAVIGFVVGKLKPA